MNVDVIWHPCYNICTCTSKLIFLCGSCLVRNTIIESWRCVVICFALVMSAFMWFIADHGYFIGPGSWLPMCHRINLLLSNHSPLNKTHIFCMTLHSRDILYQRYISKSMVWCKGPNSIADTSESRLFGIKLPKSRNSIADALGLRLFCINLSKLSICLIHSDDLDCCNIWASKMSVWNTNTV